MFISGNTLRHEMNRAGRQHTPFLFGVDFELQNAFFIESPLLGSEVLFDFCGVTNASPGHDFPQFRLDSFPENRDSYAQRFDVISQGLKRGDSFLANLTIRTEIETNYSLRQIFDSSQAMYKLYVPGKFVCFSPERFVRIEDGRIFSHPMKGTIDAQIPDAERMILENAKERAEHNTIVDLIRNDLNMVAQKVRVNRFRYIDKIETNSGAILQVSSEIEGQLPQNYHEQLGDILFRLLPAGSVSGAPKEATLDLIRKAEKMPRGFYTGVAGYYDGNSLDSCVLIRLIEADNGAYHFRSGGGITINSDCESEYLEAIQKIYVPIIKG